MTSGKRARERKRKAQTFEELGVRFEAARKAMDHEVALREDPELQQAWDRFLHAVYETLRVGSLID